MRISRYKSDLLLSNMYVIEDEGSCVVVDPFRDLSAAEGFRVDYILLTHEHYDHISGVLLWKEKHQHADVVCSKDCAAGMRSPRKNMARYFPTYCEMQTFLKVEGDPLIDFDYSCQADITFQNEMTLVWKGHTLNLFEIPGHSKGSIGILLDQQSLFSGDSVLPGMKTECRFPGGSQKDWEELSLPKIAALPKPLRIYPGHFEEFVLQ